MRALLLTLLLAVSVLAEQPELVQKIQDKLGAYPKPNAALNLATFNIRNPGDKAPNDWNSRLPRVQAVIEKYDFDIIGFQEVVPRQLSDLLKDKRWDAVGVAREDGHHGGEHCCILYRKDRLKLICTNTFWLSETPHMPGSRSWKTACVRICTWGKFKDLRTGKTFLHFNTHLDHISKAAKVNGMKVIIDMMKTFPDDIPKILTGDFNSFPDSEAVATAGTALTNAATIAKNGCFVPPYTYHAFGKATPPPPDKHREIDYIFVTKNISVDTVKACEDSFDGLYPSDHFPVYAFLLLP